MAAFKASTALAKSSLLRADEVAGYSGVATLPFQEDFFPGSTVATVRLAETVLVEEQNARIRRALTAARRNGPAKDPLTGSWTLRSATLLEQASLRKAKTRTVENRTQKQVVLGKEYKGPQFVSTPTEIRFDDFEVGRDEERTITLTNVTWSFSSFKLLDLPLEISDFFDVHHERPGDMSAGMTCDVTVRFTPKVNEDIDSQLRFLGKFGEFQVPLVARTKKITVSVTPSEQPGVGRMIEFGQVTLAEKATRTIVIENVGALSTRFGLIGPATSEAQLVIKPDRYDEVYLAPRTTRIITVDYTAAVVGDVDTSVVVHFNDHTTRDVIIRITASGTEPPVCVEEGSDIIDFRCCITDGLYRDQLTVRNRGKSSIKVTPTIPAALKAYLEYSPKFGFVQPRGKLSYQIKFRPSKALLRQIAGGGNGNGVLDQKIRIEVLGQLYPVHYQLKAILTVADLRLSSSFLDFRTCVDGEAVSRELRVKNEGNMPVEMGMLDVPPEVKVSPRLGFACIQPNAEKMFVVTFRRAAGAVKASSGSLQLTAGATPVEGEWRGRLLVKNERGGEYPVQLIAACVRPVLELSASLLKLPATALGDRRDATVLLTNRTNAKQTYRFCTDSTARVGIVISPACGIVEAKSSEPLLVTFGPDVLLDVFSPPFETSPDARCPSYHADIFSSCIIKDQPQSSIALQVRVCVVLPTLLAEPTAPPATPSTTPVPPESPVKSGKTATKDNKLALPKSSKDMRHSAPPTPKAPLVKEARTPLPPPPSHDEPRAFVARLRSDNNLRCVHFGVAPAFQSVTRTFHLRNTGAEPCVFTVQLLDPYGPFTVAKPPALPVNPGSYCAVAVTFRPVAEASYREELVATAAAAVSTSIVPTGALNNVHVTLQGRGLAPALTAALDGTPTENPSFVVVPMGDCVAQNVLIKHGVADLPTEARRRELKLLNSCSFAVPFKVSFVPSTAHPLNHSGSNPFSVVPQMGEVPASGHTVLSLVFAPDHSFEGYRAEAVCEYGGLEQRIKLCFSGSAWPRSLYLKCPSALTSSSRVTTTDDARIAPDPLLIDETLTSLALDFESDDTPLAPAEQPRYQLDFHPDIAADKRVVREAQRTVFVGNMKGSDARMAAPSEVSIDPKQLADAEALGFKISGLTGGKLALPAGAPEAKFEVTFSGKDASGFVAPDIFNQLPVPGVSIDVETTLALSLKGGWPPQPEGATAFLLLKGSIKIPTQ